MSGCLQCPARRAGNVCLRRLSRPDDRILHRQRLAPRRVLVLEGSISPVAFVITSGLVSLYKSTADGRRQVVTFRGAGRTVGLECLVGDPAPYTAQALRPVVACAVDLAGMREAVQRRPQVAATLRELLRGSLARAQRRALRMATATPGQRLADLLLEEGMVRDGRATLGLHEMARHLGVSDDTLRRSFGKLSRQGIVRMRGRRLDVLDRDALRRHAWPR